MREIVPGMTARSLAGHDKGGLFVILRTEGEYLWLCDGKLRPVEKPKKKKRKHVQISYNMEEEICKALAGGNPVRNEEIRKFLSSRRKAEEAEVPFREGD